MFWWLWITKCTSQGGWFWVIILWVVLSGVEGCLFWHWGRHNCFDLQTLITAVTGSCLRGTCHLLHDLLPFLMLLKKMAGWPAGVFGAEGGSWQGFLESSDERVNTSLCLPCTTPPSQSGHHHFLPGWMLSHSSCPLVCTLACFHASPTLCFSHIVCHSLANTFYWVPSGLIFTLISKPQAPQDIPPCSRTPSLLQHPCPALASATSLSSRYKPGAGWS